MFRRLSITLLAGIALLALAQNVATAQDTKTHEGIIVSAESNKLVMTDRDGKNQHTHMVGLDAKVTLDGKPAKLADLKKGQFVKVTTRKDLDKQVVSAIDATTKSG